MALTAAQALLARTLSAQLGSFGFNVSKYIDEAIRSGVSDVGDYAYALIIQSPEFKAAFPGIYDPQGRLRVSPQEYLARAESFQSTAAQYGFALSKAQIGGLVQNNVDPQEFQVRAAGIQTVNTYPDIVGFLNGQIDAYNRHRAQLHQPLIPKLKTKADAVAFFTGQADSVVYAAYEGALFQSQAKEAGLAISQGTGLVLAGRTPGVETADEAQKHFSTIASELRDSKVDLNGFGLGLNDLLTIEFGGPNREALAAKAEQALAQTKANQQNQVAGPQLKLDNLQRPVLSQGAPAAS